MLAFLPGRQRPPSRRHLAARRLNAVRKPRILRRLLAVAAHSTLSVAAQATLAVAARGARPVATAAVALSLAVGASASPPARHPAPATRAAPAAALPATTTTLWHQAQDVAIFALGLIGVDYRFGGESPTTGVDCSGLVRYVFQQTTGITLPRTSAQQGKLGASVGSAELMPGDLVFFNTRRFVNSHVGIYLGDNRFVHAPSRGSEVEISSLDEAYWRAHFTGARRLIGVLPDIIPTASAAEPVNAAFGPGSASTSAPGAVPEAAVTTTLPGAVPASAFLPAPAAVAPAAGDATRPGSR